MDEERIGQQPTMVVQEQEVRLEKPAVKQATSLPPPASALPPLQEHAQEQHQQVESPASPISPRPGQQQLEVSRDTARGIGNRPPDPHDGNIQRGRIQCATAEKQQQQAQPQQQQQPVPPPPPPAPSPHAEHQKPVTEHGRQIQAAGKPSPWPPPPLLPKTFEVEEPWGSLLRLAALIARPAFLGKKWFGVWGDRGKYGEEERKRGKEWERQEIGTGVILITFVSWGEEPAGRRLTKPKREGERERFTITRHLTDTDYCSQKAHISHLFDAFYCGWFWFCGF